MMNHEHMHIPYTIPVKYSKYLISEFNNKMTTNTLADTSNKEFGKFSYLKNLSEQDHIEPKCEAFLIQELTPNLRKKNFKCQIEIRNRYVKKSE